jgi:hypothetical protein
MASMGVLVVYEPVGAGQPVRRHNTVPVVAVEDLARLHGPRAGMARLPLHLDWGPSPVYDLADPIRVRTMYETVLREAASEADLAEHLNPQTLLDVWPELRLPPFLREVWERAHPALPRC